MKLLARLAGLASSHVLGMVAYTILSPAVVSFTVMILATLGFWLVAGGINEQDGLARGLVENVVLLGDGRWIEWLWREERSFEANALRLFGMVGFVGWLLDLVVGLVRRAPPEEPPPLLARLGRVLVRLAVLTLVLCLALLAAVLVAPRAPGQGPDAFWILRSVATALVMGGLLYAMTAPAVAGWYLLNQLRPTVAAVVRKGLAPRATGPEPREAGRE